MKLSDEEFQIKRLVQKDVSLLQKLIELFQEVFEMKYPVTTKESYLQGLLKNPHFIVYGVIHKNKIVGGLTAYELPMYYSEHSEMFIYDMAVKDEFQRKGLGKKLILTLKEYCRQKGIREMFVAANEEDKHALDFYRSTGGKAEKVVHFNYYQDQL